MLNIKKMLTRILRGEMLNVKRMSNTVPKEFNAGQSGFVDVDIALANYRPIGIVGVTGSGTGSFAFEDFYLLNDSTARLYLRNLASGKVTVNRISFDILYTLASFVGGKAILAQLSPICKKVGCAC